MRVILFRTPAEGDTYVPALAAAGYSAISIPALSDTLLPTELEGIIRAGGAEWEAAIITSRRAAEAWVLAAKDYRTGGLGTEGDWSSVPVWSPGPAVQSVFTRSNVPTHLLPRPAPTAVSAAALAPLILASPPRTLSRNRSEEKGGPDRDGGEERERYKPYLILTGDKTLPLLTEALRGAGRVVERVKVYETREDLDLGRAIRNLRGLDEQDTWIALFSPSSASFVLPHFEAAGYALKKEGRIRLLAIGETTESALRAGGWRVDAVAKTPDAPGLVAAIVEADRGHGK
ncbi:uncharacterized protein CcaverHIS019_0112350 [Cutaneotrichosporon cavernicola]|uniref:Tetrapyrrole biosynthesis uroporphyrinogen III synthase domain-containing protein n=1 Tax=Cutaneotrichosporon cavernicola TaxID=279322 RepID=A0AA48I986_9TREE|nr:uncharacterized protein CcaverHIS019_0112350 [Cutaneotrichosporon cavernicola]BEI88517.1 hypothetical protein CcaverHIS019_0112350 [Cutaneotrichosporon cavernicola]BEI96290.1 hypothetical protein CcaverHIS631_0112390 [Cutaneotrichosporon cavernicola]BEJ04062.1 hypothetical protein CcaverHIS641_0112370 [Cutaneotrichosporon cavernicola]